MIAQSITDDQFADIVGKLWDAPTSTSARSRTISENRTGTLRQLFRASETNEAIRGTRWAAYQAVTEYTDHFAPIGDKGNPTLARAERVAGSGTVTALKTKAFELIAAL